MTEEFEHPSGTEEQPAQKLVAQFEGDFITELEGRLPATSMAMSEGYTRGTYLRLELEVRVKSVRHEERGKGDLVRQHVFAIETVHIKSAFQPGEVADSIGGSAATNATQSAEEAAELGLTIGRSSDQWGVSSNDAVGF
jgi:hypothetical protein